MKNVLDSTEIKLEAVKDIEASYGIALAGEAKRVKQCVNRYARENSQEMLLKISKDAFTFKVNRQGVHKKYAGSDSVQFSSVLYFKFHYIQGVEITLQTIKLQKISQQHDRKLIQQSIHEINAIIQNIKTR